MKRKEEKEDTFGFWTEASQLKLCTHEEKIQGWPNWVEHGPSMGRDWWPVHAQALQGLHFPPGQLKTRATKHKSRRRRKWTLLWNYLCPLQVMEDGRPFLDMAHVITSLNRLDAGIPDKVLKLINLFSCRNISQLFRCVWCRGTNLMFWWWAMLSSKTAWNRWNWYKSCILKMTW